MMEKVAQVASDQGQRLEALLSSVQKERHLSLPLSAMLVSSLPESLRQRCLVIKANWISMCASRGALHRQLGIIISPSA